MRYNNINEKKAVSFTKDLLDYYSTIDNKFVGNICTSDDAESLRNNVGWYNYNDGEHRIYINIPNILCAKPYIERGVLDNDSFYAFLTLCVGHEFRHFLQGRCIYDEQELADYGQNDVFNSELMLYVRYFFDAYYLLNKGYVKYEIDAEKFSVENGVKYLKEKFPNIDAERAMTEAVKFYAGIQSNGFISPTLPVGCKNFDEIVSKLSDRLNRNYRCPDLRETLFVYNPRFYSSHQIFGLDENKVITHDLLCDYSILNDGSKQDLMVVKQILSLLERPTESLEQFPRLKKRYLEKTL